MLGSTVNSLHCASVLKKLISHLVSNSCAHAPPEHKPPLIFVSPDGLLRFRIDEPKQARTSVVRCALIETPLNSGGSSQNRICAIWALDKLESARIEQANSQFFADQVRTLSATKIAQVDGPDAPKSALIWSQGKTLARRAQPTKRVNAARKSVVEMSRVIVCSLRSELVLNI